eukprot:COSAG06_NODE_1493_length_9279_cov_5.433878_1_plen_99_part_00
MHTYKYTVLHCTVYVQMVLRLCLTIAPNNHDQLFEPERIARIHYQNPIPPGAGGADPTALPSLEAVLDATIEAALPSAGMPCARGAVSMTHYCELHND